MLEHFVRNKFRISLGIIVILHAVGVLGILSPYRDFFLSLTPANLIISTALLLWNSNQILDRATLSILVLFFLIGFLVEVWGVNTGIVFGEYTYGPVLGWKLWNTPLMIGLNWLMLVVATGATVALFEIPTWSKIVFSAILMVALDFFIEPVAIKLNFWKWVNAEIPLQNYGAWFITSLVLQTLHFTVIKVKPNKIAPWLLLVQWLFFLFLR